MTFIYGILFVVFLGPLIALQKTFLHGDYWVQFFPWSFHYSEALRSGTGLPYWTSLVGNGFPLMAEGQVAGYYLLHLLSYATLPFQTAYTWLIPLHILIGGAGFYAYMKKTGTGSQGAALAAVIFSFSSSYGGCFYTTGTLRVLSWLPWCLWIFEGWLAGVPKKERFYSTLGLGVLCSQMWTAGFPQLAVYAFFYLFLILLLDARRKTGFVFLFVASSLTGILLSLPQILQTAELARHSIRAGQDVSFAFWGSTPPFAAVSLIFPDWGMLLRTSFYVGIIPLLFILTVLFLRKKPFEKTHLWLALIFFLLACGKYNPLYKLFVETFSLTAVRNPSKFLFFGVVSLGVLAGSGYERYLRSEASPRLLRRIGFVLLGVVIVVPCLAQAALSLWGPDFLAWGHRYAESVFAAKTNPIKQAHEYHAVIDQFFLQLKAAVSFQNRWIWNAAGFLLCGIILFGRVPRDRWFTDGRKYCLALAVAVDLFLFSFIGTGFIGNARPMSSLAPAPLLQDAKELAEKKLYNTAEWARSRKSEILPASSNMVFGIPHAGVYSPLILKRYYELARPLGFVDASLGRPPFSKDVWEKQRPLLDLLGIGVVLSNEILAFKDFRLVGSEGGRYLYENPNALPLIFFTYQWRTLEDKNQRLDYLRGVNFSPRRETVVEFPLAVASPASAPDAKEAKIRLREEVRVEAGLNAERPAVVVFRNAFYPRWKAKVDGRLAPLIPVNHGLSGVVVDAGEHTVLFYYDNGPDLFFERASLGFWIILIGLALWARKK